MARTVLLDFKDCKVAVGEVITVSRGKVKILLSKDEIEAIYQELVGGFPQQKASKKDEQPSKYTHDDLANRKAESTTSAPIDPKKLKITSGKSKDIPIAPELEMI